MMYIVKIETKFTIEYENSKPILLSTEGRTLLLINSRGKDYFIKYGDSKKSLLSGILFKDCIWSSFNFPGEELLYEYDFNSDEFDSCSFFQVINSKKIEYEESIARRHDRFNKVEHRWRQYKHYLVVFDESLFECIANSYTILHDVQVMNQIASFASTIKDI